MIDDFRLDESVEIDEIQDDSNEMHEHFRLVAEKGLVPVRVDKFLTDRIDKTRSKIQEAADAGCILVNDKPVKSNHKIKPNDVVSLVLSYPPTTFEILAEDIPLNIVYEDDSLLVINKEPGMVVHPSYGHYTGTLVNALAYHLRNEANFDKEDPRPGLVHRIDKNTSGIIVIAKTDEAKAHLSKQFFDRTSYRRYVALVWGNFDQDEGTITGNVGRSLKNRQVMTVFPEGDYGKHAVTHYKVLERFGYITMVECRLETGRTHQIRVHFQHIGHPLFNDNEYGGDRILKGTTFTKYKQFIQNCFKIIPRHALHAKSLGFTHPKTGEPMMFDSEIPKDMQEVIEKWRVYTQFRHEEEEE
jgi:23S rRNA pseudouridine1911/1915/1917 synthase